MSKWLAPIVLVGILSPQVARALNFTIEPPSSCDPLNITWTGGTAPFTLIIAPLFEQYYNISIPSSAFDASTQSGSFSTSPLQLDSGKQFVLTLSDASGFGSGGVSDLLTTGSSITGSQCNTTSPSPPFTFSFLTPLQQCSNLVVGDYTGSIQPNTIRALIPLGQVISLTTDPTQNSLSWQANAAAGTKLVFIMTDSTGQAGGASDLETVLQSNDASCINSSSPHSTASSSTLASSTSQSSSTSQPTQTGGSKSTGRSTGMIVGIAAVVASLILLGILGAVYHIRRRNQRQRTAVYENDPQVVQAYQIPYSSDPAQFDSIVRVSRQKDPRSVDLMAPAPSTYAPSSVGSMPPSSSQAQLLSPGIDYQSQPYLYSPHEREMSSQYSQSSRGSHYPSSELGANNSTYSPQPQVDSLQPLLQPSVPSSPEPSNSYLKSQQPKPTMPRFILHTDIEDPVEPAEDEVIELPPQYSERRAQSSVGPSSVAKS
ncbi:hypothetical protein SCHPADRAFT_889651 [Schizopora paradoxa]|uniref:Mid2 domain-containing protein n=1 Tax=Schizopora paradoxa TaxID=27342 RepID=A0A0H2RQY0_9AGAM|nr:hypothetical protein SCHPADRAFT_889651 [Schizopora paradoxa]